jgi:hypothetical protein
VASFLPLIAASAEDSSPNTQPQSAHRPVKITISKETTYLTGPIRSDGWLDYAAVVNERCKSGVTAENNAAIPFWQAVGPKEIAKNKREQFFRLLGFPPLPEEGHYLVQLYVHLAQVKDGPTVGTPEWVKWCDDIDDQSRIAQLRPWSHKEFPVLAGWLDVNAKPLEIICTGADRSRFFEPIIVKPNGSLLDALDIMDMTGFRCAVQLLRLRAMLHVADGKIDNAWRDLLVCHRLARLEGQKAFLVDGLAARGLEQKACDGDVALVYYAHPTSEKLDQFHRELLELSGMPPVESCFLGERLFSLDFLRGVAAGDPRAVNLCGGFFHEDRSKAARSKLLADRRIDWDVVFRAYNSRLDEVEQAWHQPTIFRKHEALMRLGETASVAANRVNDPKVLTKFLLPETSNLELSRQLAEILLDSGDFSSAGYAWAEAITTAKAQLTNFAFALASFHNDHAAYPRSLAELSPNYLSEVPKDPCSDREFLYRPRGNGYLLYSVGRNGKDDGGSSWMDNPKEFPGATDMDKVPDDIAIRTPEAKP